MVVQRRQGSPAATTEADLDHALEIFLAERTQLFRIAHRVIGDVSAAEEVVQEAWLRWQRADRAEVRNSAAFLRTVTAHLAINVVQSARRRREKPADSALTDADELFHDRTGDAERIADVEHAVTLLAARLMPAELVAYLLRKGFDYPYGDIAHLLGTSVPNARQLVRRAQPHIEGDRRRTVVDAVHHRVVTAFMASSRSGNLELLEGVLTDYVLSADGPNPAGPPLPRGVEFDDHRRSRDAGPCPASPRGEN
jgi:DNA-directed RNA polymerase specialized sigma24 family protein